MKRRSFIKYSSLLSTPLLVGGIPISSIARSARSAGIGEESDRVLVLVQLNGGNDGLATIFPMNSYDALANVRSNIIVPEGDLLDFESTLKWHPSLSGFKSLYENAQMNIIQNVGYPQQNRSHFRSTDIWNTGSSFDEFKQTGWLGRYLDAQYPSYPSEYPNLEFEDPFALTIGNVVSETCQGLAGNFSMALADPNNISQLATPVNNELASGCGADQLGFLVNAIEKSNEYGDRIREAYELGNNSSALYNDDDRLNVQLKTVARLISGGLKSKVYVVNIGGFDTHANQTEIGDPLVGQHADLLTSLGSAIAAFQDDLKQLGVGERVLGLTYSEFGRRIRSNASYGTDHGDAAPLFVFGQCVNAGVIGSDPVITKEVDGNKAVDMETDFRDIYGSVLIDWFEASEEEVKDLLHDDFKYIPIAANCNAPTAVSDQVADKIRLKVYPNPAKEQTMVEFQVESSYQRISLLNSMGQEIRVISNRRFETATHQIPVDLRSLVPGQYYVQMIGRQGQSVRKLVKI
ncbi:DUF1501 domain-containing protein [Portibacter marinus]|uniref:DUF1501 domain-containing protein n=1 Tax=Portibacter marinus TaxID=2898660 RepID=UPI001F3C45C7|nr:DUF1501 domain-containing protein [Portibacter marinus]